jgi:pimeloyl-ACP methyl ester carboxylesterase
MSYIEENCGGHLFALGGVSLGGQIVMELLSRKADITRKAIIDGSLCFPQPGMARYCMAVIRFGSRFMFSEKACRRQIRWMPKLLPAKMQYPEEIQAYYIQDMPRVRMESLEICTVLIWQSTG